MNIIFNYYKLYFYPTPLVFIVLRRKNEK